MSLPTNDAIASECTPAEVTFWNRSDVIGNYIFDIVGAKVFAFKMIWEIVSFIMKHRGKWMPPV